LGDAIIGNETLAWSVMHDWLETWEFDAELEGTRACTVVYMYRNTNILKPVLIQAASLILRQYMTDFPIRSAKLSGKHSSLPEV